MSDTEIAQEGKKELVPYCEFIRAVSYEKFLEIYTLAPRKSRAIIAKRVGVKKKTKGFISGMKDRNDKLVHDIYDSMLEHNDHQLAEQLIRNFLYNKRPMLKVALDYMHIPNDDGLTEGELDAFEKLSAEEAAKLQATLKADFPAEDVYLYLRFLNVPHIDAI